jgi:hypothetical protein
VLEQIIANDDLTSRSPGKLFVLFLLRVRFVVYDEVDYGCSLISLDDEYFLALCWY